MFALIENKLGDIFLYRDEILPEAASSAARVPLTPEALAIFPSDLLERMYTATISARFETLLELIDEAEPYSAAIAAGLRKLANDYQYDMLIKLLQRG